jgi:hypothetical protein
MEGVTARLPGDLLDIGPGEAYRPFGSPTKHLHRSTNGLEMQPGNLSRVPSVPTPHPERATVRARFCRTDEQCGL